MGNFANKKILFSSIIIIIFGKNRLHGVSIGIGVVSNLPVLGVTFSVSKRKELLNLILCIGPGQFTGFYPLLHYQQAVVLIDRFSP